MGRRRAGDAGVSRRRVGFPVGDDIRLFEKICLEGFQSGLSWRTILNKRDNFRKAFAGFDFHELAQFDEHDVERLLGDTGIIRHRGKIEAAINNARRAVQMQADEGSVAAYIWRFEPGPGGDRYPAVQSAIGNVGRAVEGPAQTGLEVRRADHRVRLHAVDGPGQRPPARVHHPPRRRIGAAGVHPTELTSGSGPRSAHPEAFDATRRPLISSTRLWEHRKCLASSAPTALVALPSVAGSRTYTVSAPSSPTSTSGPLRLLGLTVTTTVSLTSAL